MMKRWMHALLSLCLLLPLGAVADDADDEFFSDIFVFGNSLSDTGNLAAFADFQVQLVTGNPNARLGLCFFNFLTLEPDFPCDDLFFMSSRVSNGPVAVEILAKRLDFDELKPSLHFLEALGLPRPFVGTNYAVGGATAQGDGLGDLTAQVDGFLSDVSLFPERFQERSEALYVIIIGGNDILAAVDFPDVLRLAIIANAVNAIGSNIDALIYAGARRFLVTNSIDIGSVPAAGMDADLATSLTKEFNKQLAERLDQIRVDQQQFEDLEIKEFNLFHFFEVVRRLGKLLGIFVNIDEDCFKSEIYRAIGRPAIFHPDCGPDRFNRFVFFDDLHPTGLVHRIVGKALAGAARKFIDD